MPRLFDETYIYGIYMCYVDWPAAATTPFHVSEFGHKMTKEEAEKKAIELQSQI